MPVSRNHPLKNILALFALGLVLVLAFIIWGSSRRHKSLEEWQTLQRRLQFSQSGSIAPSAAVLESIERANSQLGEINTDLNAQLYRVDPAGMRDFKGDSTAAYFELAGFVETTTREMKTRGIGVKEEERFGFAEFSQQGPDPEVLHAVMAQKSSSEVILGLLAESSPVFLHAFKREFLHKMAKESSVLRQAAGVNTSRRTHPEDTIDSGEKVGEFESYSFEISFEGYTESLRRFLKSLNTASVPILVRGLRVEPLDRYESENAGERSTNSSNPFDVLVEASEPKDGPVPIIRSNLSLFHLNVEVFLGKGAPTDS
jgi:hypothetical protein